MDQSGRLVGLITNLEITLLLVVLIKLLKSGKNNPLIDGFQRRTILSMKVLLTLLNLLHLSQVTRLLVVPVMEEYPFYRRQISTVNGRMKSYNQQIAIHSTQSHGHLPEVNTMNLSVLGHVINLSLFGQRKETLTKRLRK